MRPSHTRPQFGISAIPAVQDRDHRYPKPHRPMLVFSSILQERKTMTVEIVDSFPHSVIEVEFEPI
jgi:hypothetical protein